MKIEDMETLDLLELSEQVDLEIKKRNPPSRLRKAAQDVVTARHSGGEWEALNEAIGVLEDVLNQTDEKTIDTA